MKRFLPALAVFAVFLVAGCGGGGSSSPSPTSSATPTPSGSTPVIRSITPSSGKATANNVIRIDGDNLNQSGVTISGDVGGVPFNNVGVSIDSAGVVFVQAIMDPANATKIGIPQPVHLVFKNVTAVYADPLAPPSFTFTN